MSALPPLARGVVVMALLVLVGALDVATGYELSFSVFYLMPIVLAFCRDHNIAASKLLIPLSYATILGGTWPSTTTLVDVPTTEQVPPRMVA